MLQRIKERFEQRALSGVEVRLGKAGVDHINACTLRLSGDLLSVTGKKVNLKNIAQFAKHFKPGPVAICLTGKGVLTKEVKNVLVIDKQVVQLVMPNANPDEFYFQLHSNEQQAMVSLIRRKVADEILSELNDLGFQIVALSLGELDDDPAYKAAFQVLLDQEIIEVQDVKFAHNRRQMFAKARVLGIAVVFGSTLFFLLIINFLLSGYFAGKADQLALKRNATGMEIKKYQEMEADVLQKAVLITHTGWAGGYPLAWLTDQLMVSKPAAITLRQLSINPLKPTKIQGATSTEIYEVNKIMVSGFCDQAATLNNWLFEIRSKSYVAACTIGQYELNKESGMGNFTIHIVLKDYEG